MRELVRTFWYSHIRESNFDHTRVGTWDFIPRTIYALGVVPSLLMLLGLGLARGDRVGVLAFNRIEWLEIYTAMAKSGSRLKTSASCASSKPAGWSVATEKNIPSTAANATNLS